MRYTGYIENNRIFRIMKYNLPVVRYLQCQTLLVTTSLQALAGFYKEMQKKHSSLEMSALSCTGMRQERSGRTALLFKIETLKEAKLTHDKLLNSQFFWKGEGKKSLFISEMIGELPVPKITFPFQYHPPATLGANRVGDFTSSPLHKRLPNPLQPARQNKDVKYILDGRGLKRQAPSKVCNNRINKKKKKKRQMGLENVAVKTLE